MAVDSRLKRNSVVGFQQPWVLGVSPDTSGISQPERQAVLWCYSGIAAGTALGTGALFAVESFIQVVLADGSEIDVLLAEESYIQKVLSKESDI